MTFSGDFVKNAAPINPDRAAQNACRFSVFDGDDFERQPGRGTHRNIGKPDMMRLFLTVDGSNEGSLSAAMADKRNIVLGDDITARREGLAW